MGMRLLRMLSSLALSRYGDGEVKHILARGSDQDKLQCVVSLLHMLIACGSFSRHQLLSKGGFEQVIHFLFVADAPQARAAIITTISLYAHVNSVSKRTERKLKFNPCPDITSIIDSTEGSKGPADFNSKMQNQVNSVKHGQKETTSEAKAHMTLKLKQNCHLKQDVSAHDSEQTPLSTLSHTGSNSNSSCVYTTLSPDFDLSLVVVNESFREVFRAHKETIIRKSVYFSSMLGGGYEESTKNEIILRNLSIPGFEYVVHYLHGCVPGCPIIDSIPLEIKCIEPKNVDGKNSEFGNVNQSVTCNANDFSSGNGCSSSTDVSLNQPSCSNNDIHPQFPKLPESFVGSDESASQKGGRNCPVQNVAHSSIGLESNDRVTECPPSSENSESNYNPEEVYYTKIDSVIDKCEEVLSTADQFVLTELIEYITCVLSHTCLFPHTCEFIFGLACFYKLNDLTFDCVIEMILSTIPRSEVSAFILKMAHCGYRAQVENVLRHVVSPL